MPNPSPKTPGTTNPEERRQATRTRLTCPLAYQILQDGEATGALAPAVTVDISTRGALIRTAHPLPLGQKVRLQVQVPGVKTTLLALGRVVRIEEEEPAQKYLLGIYFEKIEPPEPAEFLTRLESLDLTRLLESLLKVKGSDLHLTTGQPPIVRIHGRLTQLEWPAFQPGEIRAFLYSIMSEEKIQMFEKERELDFAYSLSMDKRFRFNLHWQRGQVEAAIRVISARVATWDKLGLPPVIVEWARKPSGLVLVVGPTGSGKTTTLNSLVHQINQERDAVIICLERPIEYIHKNVKAVIKQREIGSDTLSYAEAVRRALRQDPDIIFVGEVEDAETAQVVLNASETGNLVLASFHATNTIQAIDRFLSLCSPQQRNQICFQLAACLQGILTQYLLPQEEAMGGGLVLATEVFVPTEAARNHIRNNTLSQIYSIIETGGAHQMHTLERSIRQLVTQGKVPPAAAESQLALAGQGGS
ncbi:MAG: PilT/PilU family type 4a pilus ATPase [Candidatus Omnitrophica bacterium]|nr:PilT/PilU family type 4a pilus ATPase [Candidatus Omnitrophota bacterium]